MMTSKRCSVPGPENVAAKPHSPRSEHLFRGCSFVNPPPGRWFQAEALEDADRTEVFRRASTCWLVPSYRSMTVALQTRPPATTKRPTMTVSGGGASTRTWALNQPSGSQVRSTSWKLSHRPVNGNQAL